MEGSTGRMLGTVRRRTAPATLHPGAVHIHQGETYVVDELDLDERGRTRARRGCRTGRPRAREVTDITIESVLEQREHGAVAVALVEVEVTHQVVGYLRTTAVRRGARHGRTGHARADAAHPRGDVHRDTGVAGARRGCEPDEFPGSLHAAEHAAIGLLPLVATCDRWDIGGVSHRAPSRHRAADGVRLRRASRRRGIRRARPRRTRALAARHPCDASPTCECAAGCPSCVQSPKCGNGNSPLDKTGAIRLLAAVLDELTHDLR